MSAKRQRIRRQSKAGAARARSYTKVRKEFLASCAPLVCERCRLPQRPENATIHHKRGRAGALLTDTRHWSILCIRCHQWVGDNPNAARECGLLCEIGKWNTPDKNAPMD
jgi:hypothetical protein